MLIAADLLCVWCAALVAVALCFFLHIRGTVNTQAAFLLLYSGLVILFCDAQMLYSPVFRSCKQETIAVARGMGLASALLTAFIYISALNTISPFVIVATMLVSLVAIAGTRYVRRRKMESAAADGFKCRNVLIVGTCAASRAVCRYMEEHRYLGYVVAGSVSVDESAGPLAEGVLGSVRDLPDIARARFIDEVIVSTQNHENVRLAIATALACGLGVRVIPDLYDGLAWGAPVEYFGHFPMLCLGQKRIPALALMIKRAMDVVWSAGALLVLSPLLAVIALAIRIDSPGAVFYTSNRVGHKGRIFGFHKFRTMVRDADRMRPKFEHLNERDGVLFKITNDPRITRVGRFLRKYSLDELPQLWNVMKGEMSLVGPRPPLAAEVRQYELDHLKRLNVLPGITGLWQVEARANPSFASYIALDIEYIDRWNLLLDLRILLKTAAVVVAGTGQ
jgi:exopolysaccharide biosynthesis polyprenyl glycosylphosphotransferase